MRRVTVQNETRNTELAHAEWRGSTIGRARGLMGRRGLDQGDGIVIAPCNSVTMFFMRFPLDIVYVDRDGVVVKTVTDLKPYRNSLGGRQAHIAIELPVGTIAASGTVPGDRITFLD